MSLELGWVNEQIDFQVQLILRKKTSGNVSLGF